MKRLMLALATCCATSLGAQAENVPVVVELFTSQGCSSCPPADEFMEVLAEREDVIALSMHVDYWDYIGWKDEFADPQHAERQRAYATHAGRRSVYTPELIVNGDTDIVGAKPMAVATAIEAHKAQPRTVKVELSRKGDQMHVAVRALQDMSGPFVVQMLRYQPQRVANITRGENAGRVITYVNVAQDLQVIGAWDAQQDFATAIPVPDDLPVVVLVQNKGLGRILAAARLD
ncbi:MAG: DUF1223 domain-containing protein [Roseobacter sp.]